VSRDAVAWVVLRCVGGSVAHASLQCPGGGPEVENQGIGYD